MLMGTGRTVGVVTSVLALAASALAGCDTDDAGPLSGEEWVLASAVDGGAVVEVGDDTNVRWRFVHGGCGDVPEVRAVRSSRVMTAAITSLAAFGSMVPRSSGANTGTRLWRVAMEVFTTP